MSNAFSLSELTFTRKRRIGVVALLCAGGLLAVILGWVGVSGTRDITDQLSYIASGGIVGLFLLGLGCALLITDYVMELERGIARLERRLDSLAGIEEASPEGPRQTSPRLAVSLSAGQYLSVRGAKRYHRPGCSLVEGKPNVDVVDGSDALAAGLIACRVCSPDGPGAALAQPEFASN